MMPNNMRRPSAISNPKQIALASQSPSAVFSLRCRGSRANPASAKGRCAAAHAIKGSAGLFSLGRAYLSARQLEQQAKTGDLKTADAACADVEADVSQLLAELRVLRDAL